jgi:DNA-binding LacI/PurR family transcriptional regulator
MGATLKDIAERTGFSLMTVSRVINNSGYVAAKTRAIVEQAVKDLDYRPNLLARGLINRKSSFILVVVPDVSNPAYADVTKGVEHVARQYGYSIILSNAYWDQKVEIEQIQAARGRMAEGIILVLPQLSEIEIIRIQKDIPIVVVDRPIISPEIDAIHVNQEYGAEIAVEHLIQLGHREIGFLSGGRKIANSVARQRGYERALRRYDITPTRRLYFEGAFTFESGQNAFEILMKMPEEKRPTALFAASDMMALGFMRSAFRHEFHIPGDLSLVGFDDIFLASVVNPPLTTVRHPFIEMGEAAMKRMVRKLQHEVDITEQPVLDNSFVPRETTARYRP